MPLVLILKQPDLGTAVTLLPILLVVAYVAGMPMKYVYVAVVLAILDGEGAPPRVVFHCFSGDAEVAARVVEAGWYVSFAGMLTFRNAPELRAACAAVPLDRMVLETDSPFLSPHPFRGRPNHPARVAVTARTVADLHGVPLEEVAAATTASAVRVFALPLDGRG